RRHHFDCHPQNMKKVPVNEQPRESEKTTSLGSTPSSATAPQRSESEDPMTGLQADLDRFRDLALRSQADFENYKKRCAREKEDAVKYANSALLERLVAIVDNFELGLEAARDESEQSPIYSGMTLVLKQLRDFLGENGLQAIEAEGKNSIQICTKRLRMNRRGSRKEPVSGRPP